MVSNSKKASSTVLMAAAVAILAIGGMVISLSGPSADGAQTWIFPEPEDTWRYKDSVTQSNWQYFDGGKELGIEVAERCLDPDPHNVDYGVEITKCCNWNCADACAHPLGEDACAERCEARCRNHASRDQSIFVRRR